MANLELPFVVVDQHILRDVWSFLDMLTNRYAFLSIPVSPELVRI